jgi:hypothetical protein
MRKVAPTVFSSLLPSATQERTTLSSHAAKASRLSFWRLQRITGLHNRLYDGGIAGATTDIPGDGLPDLVSARMGRFLQQGVGGHEQARGAETALQGMVLLKRLLQRMQRVALRQALDGHQLSAIGLHGEHETGTHGGTVIQDCTRPADAMFAAEMRAGEVQLLAQEIGQRHAHGGRAFVDRTVDGQVDATRCLHSVSLIEILAAVDMERLASDVARFFGGQKDG